MKSISSFVFSNNKLKNITIPESVTIICNGAFSWNSLESVTIPSSVTAIGDYAFTYNDFRILTIKGKAGSYAETYAKNKFLKFVAQ